MIWSEDLVDLIFSWSLHDILNQNLYLDKVEKIPMAFKSVEHYAKSFAFPLFEEVRADLLSAIETIHSTPYSEIVSLKEIKKSEENLYDVQVNGWENASVSGKNNDYKPMPGDLSIITNILPETVNDFFRYGINCTFACVKGSNLSTSSLCVKASKSVEFGTEMNRVFIFFLVNILTYSRIWKSLGRGSDMPDNLEIIKTVLSADSLAGESCNVCVSPKLPDSCCNLSSELNESQTAAVIGSIKEMQCCHKCSVRLIWGPPGTGKTKTITELLLKLLEMESRVVACGPTNVSVVQLASQFVKLLKTRRQSGGVKQASSLSRLGDIVLFGNKDRLKADDDLCEILLDYRVEQLVKCLAPGLHQRFSSLIDFLESCISHYEIYIEKEKTEDLAEFVRIRFGILASELRTCVESLCIHMPTTSINVESCEKMAELLSVLNCFEKVISETSLSVNEVREVFSMKEEVGISHPLSRKKLAFQLYNIRGQCLGLLKYLNKNVLTPEFLDKKLIEEFCLQNASLVFCTSSSASKLHLIRMQPLDLLVIDEAAQLKECEATIPLRLCGVKHAVLIGDEHQLPALVKSKISSRASFGRSLFERLSLLGHRKHLLDIQYRMHPSISSFPNRQFYCGKIQDGLNVQSEAYGKCFLPEEMFGPISFINVSDGKEEADDSGGWRNMVEVGVVLKIVRNLLKVTSSLNDKFSIGVVSPYSSQVAEIGKGMRSINEMSKNVLLKVNSIDGFQGGEEDVIIISTVRSNSKGSIGFLSNHQRVNVALTRARHCLWFVGNGATLANSGSVWAALICNMKERGYYFDAVQNQSLATTIIKVHIELNKIEDLLTSYPGKLQSARWKVLFSDEFRKSFEKLKTVQNKTLMFYMLLRIADGWRARKGNIDITDSFGLSRVYRFKGLYLVWSVDICKQENYTQILKIWNLLPLYEISNYIKRLENIFSAHSDEYIEHCRAKQVQGKIEVPLCWNIPHYITRYKKLSKIEVSQSTARESNTSGKESDTRCGRENSIINESLLLMKFYSLSSGVVEHLITGDDGAEMEIPFELSDEEVEIVRFPYSSFILGRSGTGKTTILTMKLFQREQQQHVSSNGLLSRKSDLDMNSKKLRQIFITVSPKLCSAVRNQIFRLKRYASGGNCSGSGGGAISMHDIGENVTEIYEIPNSFLDLPQRHYPLIITFRKFLMMLDGTMMYSYFDRLFSAKEFHSVDHSVHISVAMEALIQSKEVNFERFVSSYWPHFNNQLTKKLDPSTVFTEISSHIKGGFEGTSSQDVALSREGYILISKKRISTLDVKNRNRIYDIFLQYEKKKKVNGEFDLPDLVMDLHYRIQSHGYTGDKIDFVYIDEVQDLTLREIALLKCICSNYEEGFVFAGDTAQTIAKGVDFRFENIRSLFYKEFLSESTLKCQKNVKGNLNHSSNKFLLNQNFRTHVGVLDLAQSVIDLLYEYFPLSVDKLPPEISLVHGEAPVILQSEDGDNAIMTIFGDGEKLDQSKNSFGAEQAILVRDESSKQEILRQVGKQAILVLTIVECKGLEFEDVLLYNFFSTSPFEKHWRVIYGYMEKHCVSDPSKPISFPSFYEGKHHILCSELKQLYVAITRTRQRLWICETGAKFCHPIFDYWKSLFLVQERCLDHSFAQDMCRTSSLEEWSSRGIKLFNEGLFDLAVKCFRRSGDNLREKWAQAAGLCATADRIISVDYNVGQTALRNAADIYESIGKPELAASCFLKLGDFEAAGLAFLLNPLSN
ncbi:LOW QUALITY PROTEIN: uncharacterized protein LOC120258127 [Dioscorea cayenensis subsp. rotundata]|uniref:LOW QUALITY PROTEIN: uncharacterized protein LOC120258127 n=1 Tax=Dioscorea cayennensis subsp. rotundata TaxID=55577 RepID=A0AB40B285_DIOCR|nr:LOW QUALITY PROTEIN: uncharacterized protein LOC120258127 [Dioscorea cayenensis subsp. rotundata]